MPETKNFDLVIIGGGPAGLTAATTAADNNKSVALIDSHYELGGAGINTGTVPSKTLRENGVGANRVAFARTLWRRFIHPRGGDDQGIPRA